MPSAQPAWTIGSSCATSPVSGSNTRWVGRFSGFSRCAADQTETMRGSAPSVSQTTRGAPPPSCPPSIWARMHLAPASTRQPQGVPPRFKRSRPSSSLKSAYVTIQEVSIAAALRFSVLSSCDSEIMTVTSTPPGIPSASRLVGWIGGEPAEVEDIQLIAGGRSNLSYRLTVSDAPTPTCRCSGRSVTSSWPSCWRASTRATRSTRRWGRASSMRASPSRRSRPRAPGTRRGRLIQACSEGGIGWGPAPRSRRTGTRRPALAGPSRSASACRAVEVRRPAYAGPLHKGRASRAGGSPAIR